jgi:hypothetical protein
MTSKAGAHDSDSRAVWGIAGIGMKPFVWMTALLLAALFLSGAAITSFDVLTQPNIVTNPETKVAAGWLASGLMFLGLGIRGWRAQRKQTASGKR